MNKNNYTNKVWGQLDKYVSRLAVDYLCRKRISSFGFSIVFSIRNIFVSLYMPFITMAGMSWSRRCLARWRRKTTRQRWVFYVCVLVRSFDTYRPGVLRMRNSRVHVIAYTIFSMRDLNWSRSARASKNALYGILIQCNSRHAMSSQRSAIVIVVVVVICVRWFAMDARRGSAMMRRRICAYIIKRTRTYMA